MWSLDTLKFETSRGLNNYLGRLWSGGWLYVIIEVQSWKV